MTAALVADDLTREFTLRGTGGLWRAPRRLQAVAGLSLSVPAGRMLGLVGESGCGKTTAARLLLGLLAPTSGAVRFGDEPVTATQDARWRASRARMQMIHQDPLSALDRRLTAASQIAEPLRIHAPRIRAAERAERVSAAMAAVGLGAEHGARYPHELSGGQRQRVAIARALILRPALLVCDEPVSALDVSVQAQVLTLMQDLQAAEGFTAVFISHDLKVVRQVADAVAVMYLGRIVESGPPDAVFHHPAHPYTRALVAAIPDPRRRTPPRAMLQGEPPDPSAATAGCPFRPRCPEATAICAAQAPRLLPDGGRMVACHRVHPAVAA